MQLLASFCANQPFCIPVKKEILSTLCLSTWTEPPFSTRRLQEEENTRGNPSWSSLWISEIVFTQTTGSLRGLCNNRSNRITDVFFFQVYKMISTPSKTQHKKRSRLTIEKLCIGFWVCGTCSLGDVSSQSVFYHYCRKFHRWHLRCRSDSRYGRCWGSVLKRTV